jgi:sialate O-acetylesterase
MQNVESSTVLYNGMLHPLIPFGMKGVIWYQGEANADRAYQYRDLFPLMIRDWRTKWNKGPSCLKRLK